MDHWSEEWKHLPQNVQQSHFFNPCCIPVTRKPVDRGCTVRKCSENCERNFFDLTFHCSVVQHHQEKGTSNGLGLCCYFIQQTEPPKQPFEWSENIMTYTLLAFCRLCWLNFNRIRRQCWQMPKATLIWAEQWEFVTDVLEYLKKILWMNFSEASPQSYSHDLFVVNH